MFSLHQSPYYIMYKSILVLYVQYNSIDQYNKFTSNTHFSAASKYILDLDKVSKRDSSFSVPQLNLSIGRRGLKIVYNFGFCSLCLVKKLQPRS